MIKYGKIINEKTGLCEVGVGTDYQLYISLGMKQIDVEQSDVDFMWYLTEKCPHKTDRQKIKEQKEQIAYMSLTRGDVFRGLLKARNITKKQIRAIIEAMPETTEEEILTKELALIDFDDALEFFRGNELIDTIGKKLNISPEQLTEFFKTNDYNALSK